MTEKATDHRGCLAKGFPFWNDLTPEEQEMLCRYTRPVHYAKGARVHSPLESCVGILLLRSGQLRAYLLSEDGRDVTLYRLFGGEVCILSASCVMDSVNVDLYIDAEEDTEALCISAGIFRRLMQQNVYVRCYAYQLTAERFSDTMWTMQQILFMSADRRLAIFLTDELAKTGGSNVRIGGAACGQFFHLFGAIGAFVVIHHLVRAQVRLKFIFQRHVAVFAPNTRVFAVAHLLHQAERVCAVSHVEREKCRSAVVRQVIVIFILAADNLHF